MDHFTYRQHSCHAEDVPLVRIANDIGTPFYCYSTATLARHYHVFADVFKDVGAKICFAVKANGSLAVLRTLGKEGAGADVVSEGEIRAALKAGIAPENIVFSGVAKTAAEMRFALEKGIFQFNAESIPEVELLNEVAASLGKKAPIAIRVNPDVQAGTHAKISTGGKENKFGIAMEDASAAYAKAASLPNIRVQGVSVHIGSQLTSLAPFSAAFAHVKRFVEQLRAEGHAIETLDLGGGLGIPYGRETPPAPDDYAKMALEATRGLNCQLIFEPGRLIAGNAGVLVSRVIYVKQSAHRTFVMIDAGMNDLMRPALYGAHHEIIPLQEPAQNAEHMPVDVVGPVCESSDIFAEQRPLPLLKAGDLVVIRSTGAYGASMASTYNARPLIAETMVKGDQYAVIRPRQTYEELFARETMPGWL